MYRLNVDTILQTISYAFLNDLPVLEVLYFLLFLLHFYYIFYGPKPFITRPHFCVCPKPGNAFPTSYLVVLWVQWVKVRDCCSCFRKTKHRNTLYSFKKCATCKLVHIPHSSRCRSRVISLEVAVVVVDVHLPMQSVPITAIILSLNLPHTEVYSIQLFLHQ